MLTRFAIKLSVVALLVSFLLGLGGCSWLFPALDLAATNLKISDEMTALVDDYPAVTEAVITHKTSFTEEELKSLANMDELFKYAIFRLNTFKETADSSNGYNAAQFEKLYSDLKFVWDLISKNYDDNMTIVNRHASVFTPEEQISLHNFNMRIKGLDSDIKLMISNQSADKEQIKNLLHSALSIAKIALAISKVANSEGGDTFQNVEDLLSTLNI